jgi:hypothetical protein
MFTIAEEVNGGDGKDDGEGEQDAIKMVFA